MDNLLDISKTDNNGLRRIFLFLLLFPFPTPLNDFIQQKTFWIVSLSVSLVYLIKQKTFPLFITKLFTFFYSIILLSISLNIPHIPFNGYYDVISELIRYFSCFVLFIAIYKYSQTFESEDINLKEILIVCLVSQLFFCILYYTPLISILKFWFNLKKNEIGIPFTSDRLRLVGTFENPNYLGYFSILLLIIQFELGVFQKRYQSILFTFICTFLIYSTGSRTALICFLVTVICYHPLKSFGILFSSLPFIVLFLENSRFGFLVSNPEILLSFDDLSALQKADESYFERVTIIKDATVSIFKNPFFGVGYTPIPITDNYYMIILLRYGFIGLFSILVIYIYFLYHETRNYYKLMRLFRTSIPIFLFLWTGEFLDNWRLFIISSFFLIFLIKKIQIQ